MPIHIHPASAAQGKYFPKLSINRKTIFEQLRGETERVRKGRRWRGTGGEILILYVYMRYIFIKELVLQVKVETGMLSDAAESCGLKDDCCWNWIIGVLTVRKFGILDLELSWNWAWVYLLLWLDWKTQWQLLKPQQRRKKRSRICTDFPINEGFSLVTMTMTYQPNTREIIYNLMQSENMVIEC